MYLSSLQWGETEIRLEELPLTLLKDEELNIVLGFCKEYSRQRLPLATSSWVGIKGGEEREEDIIGIFMLGWA